MSLKIKVVVQSEVQQLLQVAVDSYTDTFAEHNTMENMEAFLRENYTAAKFSDELQEPESVTYMVWEADVPIGYARIRVSSEVVEKLGNNALELQRLYILPAHKGKKAGSGMMEEIIRYATEKRFDWIWLGVWERNFAAQKFYASWGFEKFGEHIFQMGDDPQIDWILKKRI